MAETGDDAHNLHFAVDAKANLQRDFALDPQLPRLLRILRTRLRQDFGGTEVRLLDPGLGSGAAACSAATEAPGSNCSASQACSFRRVTGSGTKSACCHQAGVGSSCALSRAKSIFELADCGNGGWPRYIWIHRHAHRIA